MGNLAVLQGSAAAQSPRSTWAAGTRGPKGSTLMPAAHQPSRVADLGWTSGLGLVLLLLIAVLVQHRIPTVAPADGAPGSKVPGCYLADDLGTYYRGSVRV